MPISGLNTYVSTMMIFESHWTSVNAELPTAKPLLLPGAYTLADFTELQTMIGTALAAVSTAETLAEQKRSDLLTKKKDLIATLELFRKTVLGSFPDTLYAVGLPSVPNLHAIQSRFLQPFAKAADTWSRINTAPPSGFTPPLVLSDDTQLATFNTMVTNLNLAFKAVIDAEIALSNARKSRDANLPTARTWMKQYRNAVYARLEPGNNLLSNIPRYTPVRGATPKGVTNLLFLYNATDSSVKLTFTPSPSKNIATYQLRYSPGTKYDPANEQTIAMLPATGPYEFDFSLDFVATGTTALFKVYVLNATGNHRASKVLKIKRTAAPSLAESDTTQPSLRLAA